MGGDRGPAVRDADRTGLQAPAGPTAASVGDTPDVLRLEPSAPASPPSPASAGARRRVVVLDMAWTPSSGDDDAIGLREVARRVLSARDLIAETADRLDGWVSGSGVVEAMTFEGTSFWFYYRLRHWMWLEQQILWLAILDELIAAARPGSIECGPGVDAELVEAARLIAARDGLALRVDDGPGSPAAARPPSPAAGARPGPPLRRLAQRALARVRRALASRIRPDAAGLRRRIVRERMTELAHGPRRLLVVLEHARQRVDTSSGPRLMNPYLGPIVDRLRGTRLDPIEIDIRARLTDDDAWARVTEPGGERLLPVDALSLGGTGRSADSAQDRAEEAAARVERGAFPVVASGVDLGPALARRVADETRRSLAGQLRAVGRIRGLLRRLRPAGILLADEYHRQEWLTAARAEEIPTVAVQHGMIYRWHNGYIHRERPASLRLADRLYVFGEWERDLLLTASVFREDEVRVGGSPRLDLVRHEPVDRDAVRAELGVRPGDRLVVVSGTWGPIYRRFHYPIGLAGLVDRPLPGVHFVVKLHPGEPDEGPYRRVVEGAAAAGGFEPPPVTIVRSIDLYRLLAAADAHLGIHSTVLTEAVATGTPNLLVDSLAAADLLGYVPARVATPIRTGGDLLAALDATRPAAASDGADAARQRFLDAHFRSGSASERIAGELLAWLP